MLIKDDASPPALGSVIFTPRLVPCSRLSELHRRRLREVAGFKLDRAWWCRSDQSGSSLLDLIRPCPPCVRVCPGTYHGSGSFQLLCTCIHIWIVCCVEPGSAAIAWRICANHYGWLLWRVLKDLLERTLMRRDSPFAWVWGRWDWNSIIRVWMWKLRLLLLPVVLFRPSELQILEGGFLSPGHKPSRSAAFPARESRSLREKDCFSG